MVDSSTQRHEEGVTAKSLYQGLKLETFPVFTRAPSRYIKNSARVITCHAAPGRGGDHH